MDPWTMQRVASSSSGALGARTARDAYGREPVIWGDLAAHRDTLGREHLEAINGAIRIEQLSGYAPELTPTEYIWGHPKHRELTIRRAGDLADLKSGARNRLHSIQRRPTPIRAF
jgi:hypothetical protein